MDTPGEHIHVDAVVDDKGNLVVPANQLPHPYPAGAEVPLDVVLPFHVARRSFRGSLAHWPRLDPQDFERASQLATEDADLGLTAGA